MSLADSAAGTAAVQPWTCPFCPLLCDAFQVAPAADGGALALQGSDCPKANAALAHFHIQPAAASPMLAGQPCSLDAALAAATALLAASRQALFGGLGTDVAGARAIYALADATGAICDAAAGAALMHGVRALQDRGGYTTTLSEVRTHADLLVCFGGLPTARQPEFFHRIAMAPDDPRVVLLNGVAGEGADAFDTAARLAALVDRPAVPAAADDPLALLAARMQSARYVVIVYDTDLLPAHGALVIEALQRAVASLNRSTRAACLALGGGGGAGTVSQVFTWLSGLPLRSRAGAHGLEHEPLLFDGARLLADGAVDLLLWVNSFAPAPVAWPTALPGIVLGHPATDARGAAVFIPVATPGIGTAGHLFRTDGSVLLPLHPVRADGLPGVAQVLQRLLAGLRRGASA